MTSRRFVRNAMLLVFVVGLALAASIMGQTWASFSQTTANSPNNITAAASFYKAVVQADGPVSYWRLGETSGTTAVDVMGTNNATYAGLYTLGSSGALVNDTDKAVDFDGLSGRASAPNSASLSLNASVSIEAWVRPDIITGTRWIVNKGTYYYLYIINSTIVFGTHNGTYLYLQSANLTTGAWQHFVGTYDGATMILYKDGVNIMQTPVTGAISTNTSPLAIASFDGTVGRTDYFDGKIDEVALYNKALTPAQVLTHYQRGAITRP